MNRVAAVTYQFILELILGMLFLFLIYINKNEFPPILLLTVLCISSIILFSFLLAKFRNNGKWLYFVTILPLILLIGFQTGLPLYGGLGLGFLIYWRGISLFDDVSERSEAILLLLSFIIGLVAIIYSAMSKYPFQSEMILLLITQLVIVLLGGFLRKWNSIQTDKAKFAVYFLKVIAAVLAIGVIPAFLLKYIQMILFAILHFFVILLSTVSAPLFGFLEYLLRLNGNEGRKTTINADTGLPDEYQPPAYEKTETTLYILLIVAAVAFIIFLYKKKFTKQDFSVVNSAVVSVSEGAYGSTQSNLFRRRMKPPEDIIRREIFELEKYASKLKLGRLPFETLEEWWQRIGLSGSSESIAIYEKVRYGEGRSSIEEQTIMKTEIHQFKQQLKEIYKSLKDKKKKSKPN
ncbi:hypothetical protein QNH39_08720 [Neobacillus novalis]|uniref:DUF4129 domain-containing protein n=1 Tax=Neobacillus novalis TaxID=220687 RepID=A0AA95SAA2_9BACI|nr:hypothetical protein [Neobacillus novalis]WHY87900.1 hypothetical protein QNH39_08720 [Neobacillus novalis]